MKKILISSFAAATLLLNYSCKTDFDTDVTDIQVTSGSANFSKYVALGNSLTSGYRDGALYVDGQNESYPSMIASKMMLAGGGAFKQPMMSDNLGGISALAIPNKLVLAVSSTGSLGPTIATGTPTNSIANIFAQGPYQNLGVPGAKSYHLLASGYGNPSNLALGLANPYYVRFASSATSTVVQDAMAQNPTFFSLWIGNNDVLGYATTGGDGTNPITAASTFTDAMTALVTTLTSGGAKGVIGNIPNVTAIPFLTTVPYNPIALDAATVTALNTQVFGPIKQILTATGDGNRLQLLTTTKNPLLIKDESLTNRAVQISQALVAAGVPAAQAGLMGQVFGQARHATSTDLVPLTTSSILGTAPTSPYAVAPFNKYGVTFPLEDKHILRGKFGTQTTSEVDDVLTATTSFNATIKSLADAKGLAFVDANTKMVELSQNSGLIFDGVKYSASFVSGGTFSLDGVHLSGRGYALIANEFIKAINKQYGSNLPQVDVNKYSGVTFP